VIPLSDAEQRYLGGENAMDRITIIILCIFFTFLFTAEASSQECVDMLRGCLVLSGYPDYPDCPTPPYYGTFDLYGMLAVNPTCDAKGVRFRLKFPQGILLSVAYNEAVIQSVVGDSITYGVEIALSDCWESESLINLFHAVVLNTSSEPYYISYEPHSEGGVGIYSCEPGSILYQCCPSTIDVNGSCAMENFCWCEYVVPVENQSWGAIKAIYK
jgi:hypothetical protein